MRENMRTRSELDARAAMLVRIALIPRLAAARTRRRTLADLMAQRRLHRRP